MSRSIVAFVVATVAFAACNTEMPLPSVTGKAGELVVVCDKSIWESAVGDSIFELFSREVYGLPQPEPQFKVVHVPTEAFSNIFRTHRNVMVLSPSTETKGKIEVRKDVWATTQLVVEAQFSSLDELLRLMQTGYKRIEGHLMDIERERILTSYKAQLDPDVVKALRDKGIGLTLPKGYAIASITDSFEWVRYSTKDVDQGIMHFSTAYTDARAFDGPQMLATVDSVLRIHVPGPDPGTFMAIFRDYPVQTEVGQLAGEYATRTVGLWHVNGALMGGPFICYATLDPSKERVHYFVGMVFAPGEDKRNLAVQVEAIIRSLSWP